MRSRISTRRLHVLIYTAVGFAAPAMSLGGAAFNSGSATWSWDADTNSANGGKTTFTIAPPSSSALPASPTFQLNKTGSFASATATGKGSLGSVANATTASWTFAGGSGVGQADPNDDLTGNTVTKVQFGGLFDVTSPSFGPTATGYFSLTAAGRAGVNGSTQIAFDMQWRLGGPGGALLRSAISDGTTFLGGASGMDFAKTWTYCSPFSPSTVTTSQDIWVGGSLTFIAANGGTPSDAAPIQFEASAAPPTATFYGPGGGNSNWFDPATWAQPSNPAGGVFSFIEPGALVPTIPDGPGVRARIVSNSSEPRALSLPNDVTLGALQIDDGKSLLIQNSVVPVNLVFNSTSGNASVHVGAIAGSAGHSISTNVLLADDLDIRVESGDPGTVSGNSLAFQGPIQNVGGPFAPTHNINISGGGAVEFYSANDYGGATNISDGGLLRVRQNGALGSGSVNIDNGMLSIEAPQPFGPGGGIINVSSSGLVAISTGSFSGATITISATAGLSGNNANLGAIEVNTPVAQVGLAPGAFIAHEDFSVNPADNPQSIGNSPLYIFAIANDFTSPSDPSIVIGANTISPWMGFGSDRLNRTYGDSPTNPGGPSIDVDGAAALFAAAGELTVNARVTGGGSNALVNILGKGIVNLASQFNTLQSAMFVNNGATLKVTGVIPSSAEVVVQAGGTLGGDGVLNGVTTVQSGGKLDPGLNAFNTALATLTVDHLLLSSGSILDFEFGNFTNDQVNVLGSLTLDGELIVNQLQDFDNQGTYPLFTYSGTLIDNGLIISPFSQPIDGVPANVAMSIIIIPNFGGSGGTVALSVAVPEPAGIGGMICAAALFGRRRWRAAGAAEVA